MSRVSLNDRRPVRGSSRELSRFGARLRRATACARASGVSEADGRARAIIAPLILLSSAHRRRRVPTGRTRDGGAALQSQTRARAGVRDGQPQRQLRRGQPRVGPARARKRKRARGVVAPAHVRPEHVAQGKRPRLAAVLRDRDREDRARQTRGDGREQQPSRLGDVLPARERPRADAPGVDLVPARRLHPRRVLVPPLRVLRVDAAHDAPGVQGRQADRVQGGGQRGVERAPALRRSVRRRQRRGVETCRARGGARRRAVLHAVPPLRGGARGRRGRGGVHSRDEERQNENDGRGEGRLARDGRRVLGALVGEVVGRGRGLDDADRA
eukprot:30918-Pelagococcus_subviridis.AAC.24